MVINDYYKMYLKIIPWYILQLSERTIDRAFFAIIKAKNAIIIVKNWSIILIGIMKEPT